jgi:imidazolonepropionase
MHHDIVIKNATIATFTDNYDVLKHATIAMKNGIITEITTEDNMFMTSHVIDAAGKLITPGLIDCHTHIIYAGNRADEFEMRLNGATYAKIAEHGGGILSTVKATRNSSVTELTKLARARASIMFAHGTTTIEIKSGYGLDLNNEVKILKVAQNIIKQLPVNIITTFLGAHSTPPEFTDNKDGYIDYLINTVLPVIAEQKLAKFVDGFCEKIAFNPKQIERLFNKASELGFAIKLHAEQLSDQKGALLATKFKATSVDHLEYLDAKDAIALKESNTVAVLLPSAYYFLKEKQLPPIKALQEAKVPIAIATDANPGSSPFFSLPLIMNMACIIFGLSIEDSWRGVTINAASALNLSNEIGSLEKGKKADIVMWDTDNLNDIVYNPTTNYCEKIIKDGKIVKE